MASSNTTQKLKLTKTIKGYLHNDREAIKTYVDYIANEKVNTGAFAVFGDFLSYDLISIFNHNEVLSLINSQDNDEVRYLKLVKMFYANLIAVFTKEMKTKFGVASKACKLF